MSLIRFVLFCVVAWMVWRYIKSAVQAGAWKNARVPITEPAAKTPHEILGVRVGASEAEIRDAYQRLVMQYHPDRVSGMGPEIVAVAEARTKEINEAYSRLKR